MKKFDALVCSLTRDMAAELKNVLNEPTSTTKELTISLGVGIGVEISRLSTNVDRLVDAGTMSDVVGVASEGTGMSTVVRTSLVLNGSTIKLDCSWLVKENVWLARLKVASDVIMFGMDNAVLVANG